MGNELLRHLLATLSHRAAQAISNVPSNFPELAIGKGTRTPIEILRHTSRVLTYALSQFLPDDYGDEYEFPSGTWEWEVDRFYSVLEKLDQVFIESRTGNMTWEQLVQGPLSDAITHVGQLTLLRRMADSPVTYENFIKANIRAGKLRPE
ncbi:hypothetical protein [Alicyclobacillus fastidiosus]|uniref:DinB family protein n=1 Tax=Alicyclobacillus fastidiosus TaxID=392011 RepID=A0ABV5ACY8_9BACL|nr:hypothetical protein [Alicyclobacillus fastidiosus]WEH08843.1 hypothetical protein PYS47_19455 [Alicyclobacillus fastidiosus]